MDPGYVNYPRGVKRELNLDCLGEGWRIMMSSPGKFVTGGFFIVVTTILPLVIFTILMFPALIKLGSAETFPDLMESLGLQLAMSAGMNLALVLGGVLAGPFVAGVTKISLDLMRGKVPSLGDIFYGWTHRPLTYLAIALLTTLGVVIGMSCMYLPGFIWGGMTMFAVCFAVDEDLSTMEAMRKGWNLAKPYVLMASVLYLILTVIAAAGLFCCLLGGVITYPFLYIAVAASYETLTRTSSHGGVHSYAPPQSAGFAPPPEGGTPESPKL